MSTNGLAAIVAGAAADTQGRLDDRAEELRQLELADPITGEEMVEARREMGPVASRLVVLAKARENRRGRPPGAKNKRTDDMVRYLQQFGTDPLVGAMILQSEPPEVLAERWGCKVIDVVDRQLRSRELLAPFLHSKKPVAVDMTFTGVADLMIEGVTHTRAEMGEIIDADFLPIDGEASGG